MRSSVSALDPPSSQPSGQPTYSVPIPRWLCVATGTDSNTRSISSSVKPSAPRRCAPLGHQLLRARACGHALRLHAHELAQSTVGGDRRPDQGVQLLGRAARDRRLLVLGVAGPHRHLGAQPLLPFADALRDVGGKRLGLEASPSTTSSIASLTISSKRDMWTPA